MIDQSASPAQRNLRARRALGLLLCTIIGIGSLSGCGSGARLPKPRVPTNFTIVFIRPEACFAPALIGGASKAIGGLSGRIEVLDWSVGPAALTQELARRSPDAVCIWIDPAPEQLEFARRVAKDVAVTITIATAALEPLGFARVTLDLPEAAAQLARHMPPAARGKSYALIRARTGQADSGRIHDAFRAATDGGGMSQLVDLALGEQADASALVRSVSEQYRHAGMIVLLDPPSATRGFFDALPPDVPLAVLTVHPDTWASLRRGQTRLAAGFIEGEIGAEAARLAVLGLSGGERPTAASRIAPHVVSAESLEAFIAIYSAAGNIDPAQIGVAP